MTRKQLERLAQLLTDTAQTASTIELRALAAGRADDGIVAMAAGLRANCIRLSRHAMSLVTPK